MASFKLFFYSKVMHSQKRPHLYIHLEACVFIKVGKFLCQRPATLLKKETLAQVFSCEFCEISKKTFFIEHLWWLLLVRLGLIIHLSINTLAYNFRNSKEQQNMGRRNIQVQREIVIMFIKFFEDSQTISVILFLTTPPSPYMYIAF